MFSGVYALNAVIRCLACDINEYSLRYSCISDFQVSADSTKLVLRSGDICLHCFMKKLFKKQSTKFVQNSSSFTKVMAKHILVCFYAPQCILTLCVTP